ncbi:PstS family phosphate ABC transporter substrate-binding protein [Gloeocapsa sp. PCC 73106]|uniref:PstS family phosphate ABC transporter substrate-binding protein n=1 Tax=Gloeocapsa sp. PCC 73106 TaxID=102232 RepID=UPI0002ABA2B1|nr:PstS family phosphate ABC transporter substrate-binding protein [Gloeocapsa sp. PCC 73106]ELR99452.1 phosphate binding protein [Gloeocapsa sp. PCC 73106]
MKINHLAISLSLLAAFLSVGVRSGYSQTQENQLTQLPSQITDQIIDIDGSSTVYPVTEAVKNEFMQVEPDFKVNVSFSGTGGGFQKFCAAQTDINGASRPITLQEMEACRNNGVGYIEIPVAFDALTVVVNPQNTWAQDITVEELKKMWEPAAQGKISQWQQVRSGWENQPLKLYGAGTDSGTYDYFAEAIVGGDSLRSDFTGSEDDTILVQGVAGDPNALGFFGFAYFNQNQDKLRALSVNGVMPSRETVEDASYQPLSRPLFIYVNVQSAQNNPNLRRFVDFYMQNGLRIVEEIGFIPLPEEAYHVGLVRFHNGNVGTVFDGVPQPGLTIQEVLQKDPIYSPDQEAVNFLN